MKFKLNDKVKIIRNDACSSNLIGDIGIVAGIDSVGNVKVMVEKRPKSGNWQYKHDVILYLKLNPNTMIL